MAITNKLEELYKKKEKEGKLRTLLGDEVYEIRMEINSEMKKVKREAKINEMKAIQELSKVVLTS